MALKDDLVLFTALFVPPRKDLPATEEARANLTSGNTFVNR